MNSYDIAKQYNMLSVDEVDLIKSCASLLPPNPICINIGANVGTSSIAVLESRPDAVIFSIDINHNILEPSNILNCGLDPSRVIRILQPSQEVGRSFPYQVDMTFIDGGHTDEDLLGDIDGWLPKTKYIVLFHDYHHPNYKNKPNVNLDEIVDKAMADWSRIGEARYLVAFGRHGTKIHKEMGRGEPERILTEGSYVID